LSEENNHSFVSFYEKHKVSPVSQNLGSLQEQFERRARLFKALAITPSYISKSKIIEFGPGSGHNTIILSLINTNTVDIVDKNSTGIEELKGLYKKYNAKEPKIHFEFFEQFKSNEEYDLCWAEGCIPQQQKPIRVLKHVASVVRPGGSLVCTSINGISYMSEILRRVVSSMLMTDDFENNVKVLTKFFKTHCHSLKGMTRPVEDWVIDSLINPLQFGRLLSIPDIIQTLKEYDVISTLPNFYTNWDWYKTQNQQTNSERLSEAYFSYNYNLIDSAIHSPLLHDKSAGKKLEDEANRLWETMCSQQINGLDVDVYSEIFSDLTKTLEKFDSFFAEKVSYVFEMILRSDLDELSNCEFFANWWGRGQQYCHLQKNLLSINK